MQYMQIEYIDGDRCRYIDADRIYIYIYVQIEYALYADRIQLHNI